MAEVDILRTLFDFGVSAVLIFGGVKGWYVWGPTHQDVIKQRDYWQARSERAEVAIARTLEKAEGKM